MFYKISDLVFSQFLIVVGIIFIGLFIIQFLTDAGRRAKKNDPHALGLPQGSVRALLAILLVFFFILIALFFYLETPENDKTELAENILTILGTLVIAVSAFYFGTKATEQGNKIAQETFEKATDYQNSQSKKDVPVHVIQEAIRNNKQAWIEQYKCEDIKIGKKKVGQTQFELACILFLVKKKISPLNVENEIPSFINYNSKGKDYEIPTDVEVHNDKNDSNTKIPLESNNSNNGVTLNIVEEAIAEHKEKWKTDYDADDILATFKVIDNQITDIPCIQFIVSKKSLPTDNTLRIPDTIDYYGLKILTDVVEEDEPSSDAGNIQVGEAVWRKGTTAKGTLGMKVYKENPDGTKTDFLLSCYHVFCSKELKNGTKTYVKNKKDSIEANYLNNDIEVASVEEGVFSSKLDAALCRIEDNVSVDHTLKGFYGIPKYGIRIIRNEDVNNRIKVNTHGAISKNGRGTVKARITSRNIKFNGKSYYFENIIPVSKISKPGDSGAMVVDDYGKVIGIVFASNSHTSYIIPILEIIVHFKINLHYV